MEKKWQNRIESKFILYINNLAFRTLFDILAKIFFYFMSIPLFPKLVYKIKTIDNIKDKFENM
jgi:hypothetical protein